MARKITGQEEGKKQTKRSNKPKVSKKKLSSSVSSGHVAIRNINQKIRQKIQLSEEDILQAKINEANKRIQKERERQIAAEVISEESGEPINLKRGEWGKKALTFAEKEIARLKAKIEEQEKLLENPNLQIERLIEKVVCEHLSLRYGDDIYSTSAELCWDKNVLGSVTIQSYSED